MLTRDIAQKGQYTRVESKHVAVNNEILKCTWLFSIYHGLTSRGS